MKNQNFIQSHFISATICTIIWGFIFASSNFTYGEVYQFDFDGLRNVHAIVQREQHGYQCDVSFLPVSCSTPLINRKINLSKSRAYAIRAMANAAGVNTGTVKIVKLTVSKPLVVDGAKATIQYKAENIERDKDSSNTKSSSGEQLLQTTSQVITSDQAGSKTLLSCIDDMRSTLRELSDALTVDISDLIPGSNLDESVANLEQQGIESYEKLQEETRREKLLLSTEKSELLNEIDQNKQEFIKRLTASYIILERNTVGKEIP